MNKKFLFVICTLFMAWHISAQLLPELNHPKVNFPVRRWNAQWVTCKEAPQSDPAVIMFRRSFTLPEKPDNFVIHVSADNRYKLYVNGILSAMGPQPSDQAHWRYETIDIAPCLQAGDNLIAAEVINWGPDRSAGIMSIRTGFLLQGNTEKERIINTGTSEGWKTKNNIAYSPLFPNWMWGVDITGGLYCANPGDSIRVADYPKDWLSGSFDDSDWKSPKFIWGVSNVGGGSFYWDIMARTTPQVTQSQSRFKVVRSEGLTPPPAFAAGNAPLVIPANTKSIILLDHETLSLGYPELILSGGKNANIRITYAENLFGPDLFRGDRNDITGKEIRGLHDVIIPDGREHFKFAPTWYRCFRYVQLNVQTAAEPLILNDFYNMATASPTNRRAIFDCDNDEYKKIDEICWRTAAICTQDNLMSDAYYEQMMYVGDSRVHLLVNQYMTGDDTWLRNAIQMFDFSRSSNGVLSGCYPTTMKSGWTSFTPVWVSSLYDFMMHCNDKAFVQSYVRGIKASFEWIDNGLADNGMIRGRGFLDWYSEPEYPDCMYPARRSASFSFLCVDAMQKGAAIYDYLDMPEEAVALRQRAEKIKAATVSACWDEERKLFAEEPEKNFFDERTNIMAIVAQVGDKTFQQELFNRALDAKDISKPAYFFCFNHIDPMYDLGLGNRLDDVLGIWKDLLRLNFTTVPERIAKQRSDAHPYSASPCVAFVKVAAGISPAEPEFKSVHIEPSLGKLNFIKASYPHYLGDIIVDLKKSGTNGIAGSVTIPKGLNGVFKFNGKTITLKEGVQTIKL